MFSFVHDFGSYHARLKADSEKYQEYIFKERERYRYGKLAGHSHNRPISNNAAREKNLEKNMETAEKNIEVILLNNGMKINLNTSIVL